MKLGAITPVFNEELLIQGCIKSLEGFVDKHVVLCADKPLYGDYAPDNTADIAEELGALVVRGDWREEHVQRNLGISLLQDCDWIICVDADMWFAKDQLEILKKELETKADAFIAPQIAYWKDTDHVLVGDDFKPVVAIRPHVRFIHIGCIDHHFEVSKAVVHHINWCEPKDIYKKIKTYSHSPEYDWEAWYRKEYENWTEGDIRMPDGKVFPVKYQPLPDELKKYISSPSSLH